MEQINLNKINEELMNLKQRVINIEINMVDKDCILTSEEKKQLEKARIELEKGETTSLKDFEKEINQNA